METFLIIGLTVLSILNVHVSLKCYQDVLSSSGQRIAQIAFVWLIPIIGAVLTLKLLRDDFERGNGKYPEAPNDVVDDYTTGLGRLNSQGVNFSAKMHQIS
ncbi:MAG: hypothetical protein HOO90_08735 [Methylotenera sp.]|uniref:hypothetical protein n=1 Tax=Methylotenera sp. TaxID=2051956 RepID=UPI00181F25B7|nr:hypothetical protein [Methylotenera sp.]NOU25611.1 hypothetical protein [Methylotenera sp.]